MTFSLTCTQTCHLVVRFCFNLQLCEQLPGTGLSGGGFFSVGGCLGDQHEQITTLTLFGGLVQGRVNSLEVKLDLPDLPEDLDSK